MKGARGLIFPFNTVKTNNPWNYKVEYTGEWKGTRCVVKKDYDKPLGLTGISATTHDSISTMKIYYRPEEPMHYSYNRLRVYHNMDSSNYEVWIRELPLVEKIICDHVNGFTEFDLQSSLDTVNLIFERLSADTTKPFTLYAIELLNSDPGIVYNSIGVNGAAFDDYLRCQLLEPQLAQHPPDLVIVSIGTNDANGPDFSTEKYEFNYRRFADIMRRLNPECALLFTVPNDNYFKYKYPQKNVAACREVIYRVAADYGAAVWDFYAIMGGFGSSQKWYLDKLMKNDRVHFTNEGYAIKGDLLSEAFLKWFTEYRQQRGYE
jgi:lysophospholipase L1-like esterase